MSNTNTESVTCAVCGQSCEGTPHAKDTKGRIICRPCIDKRKAQRAATDTGGASVMADLLSKSKMANAAPCPGCKSYMPEGTTICTHCGYNTETGKAVTTRVFNAPKQKKAKSGGGGMSLSFDPMMGVWAMALVYAGLAFGVFANPDLLMVLGGIVGLAGLVIYIWLVITAFLDGKPVWGILMLIPLVNILTLYYIFFVTDRTVIKAHYVMVICANILVMLLGTSFSPKGGTAFAPTTPRTQLIA